MKYRAENGSDELKIGLRNTVELSLGQVNSVLGVWDLMYGHQHLGLHNVDRSNMNFAKFGDDNNGPVLLPHDVKTPALFENMVRMPTHRSLADLPVNFTFMQIYINVECLKVARYLSAH